MAELLAIKKELTVIKVQIDGLLDCVDKMDRQRKDCSECPQSREPSVSPHRGSVSSLERESPEPGEASEEEPLHYQHYYPHSYPHRVNIYHYYSHSYLHRVNIYHYYSHGYLHRVNIYHYYSHGYLHRVNIYHYYSHGYLHRVNIYHYYAHGYLHRIKQHQSDLEDDL
ncbi:hypothetical protein D5F01_LYC05456 [Larimichthys crocea]|uniref:Uncharacterized protein n=1 Tax=Larimichthys crocea TaxID=215358 RepID=A0A6G0IYU4_LARCR|nr:hypothetical protein D5F01_LYC05456 [Larimichthys crocea]